jgi:hypothetical protein
MAYIAQEHEEGCGVAVLAMLTDKTWAETVEWIDWDQEALKPVQMMAWLWKDGWFLRKAHTPQSIGQETWPPAPFASAHYAMVTATKGGHWVVMTHTGDVLDPYDFSRPNLEWYPAVHEIVGLIR